ncbi:hypothetical protein Tco_0412202 [Tanacetum coccineum]
MFMVNLHHDGVFICNPVRYVYGELKQIIDIDFEGMSFNDFHDACGFNLVLTTIKRLYYCSIKSELKDGIKELKTDKDVEDFLRVGYENKWFVNLYTEHHDYDVLGFLTIEGNVNDTPFESSDEYESKPIDDPDAASIDPLFKVKRGVSYPKHDPTISWNEMQPVLGMRYEHPEQLKLALAKYGVANGYQLWYMRNDWTCMLVYCGRNVEAGRCAGMYSNKKYVAKRKLFADDSPRSEKKSNTPKKSQTGKKAKPKKKQGTPVKQGKAVKKAIPIKKSISFSPTIKKVVLIVVRVVVEMLGNHHSHQSGLKVRLIVIKKQGHVRGFRQWASWITTEQSFQIKSLHPEHKCSRNYNLGSLVTYKWIAHQFAKEIINDPFMPYIKLKDAIRQKFMIDVSIGQCKRAKQSSLYDHEGGLIEHYGRLCDYRQALLNSNPGSTCRLYVEETGCGKSYFKRFYICFKGMKDGWLEGCRRVIGLDGCFLKHTCRGELLTAMGRDANNQMYPIAWAVVRVENSENWGWFLALLHDDLKLQQGTGLTLISDGHKGLHDAVRDWLPNSEHRKCTRHIYANFKKKFSGIQLQKLFWHAASCTCPAFENGICESYHRAILLQRHKPIITMLEDIRVYLMQRIVALHNIAVNLEDHITPTVRKKLEYLKREQRNWTVFLSAYQLLEVRCGDSAFGVNLGEKTCACRLWQLSGIPCIHAVAGYMHLNRDPDEGVSQCYSQELWFKTYQHSIKPVLGTKMWKRTDNHPPLPPIVRKMHGRPRKE